MPTPRARLEAAAIDGRIYALGGLDYQNPPLQVLQVYDPRTDQWSARASMPSPRVMASVTVLEGELFAVGGVGTEQGVGPPEVSLSPDPDDNMILATAIAGEVDLLVTGDKSDLLALKTVGGIPIVTPRQALDRIDEFASSLRGGAREPRLALPP